MPAIPNPTILILHRPYLKASTILGSRGVASLPSSFHFSQCVHAFWYSRRAGIYCSALFVSTASSQSQADNDGHGRPSALTPQLVTLQEIDVNPPKGTGDFPPRKCGCAISCLVISERFQGFSGSEEVDFPVLESEALFIRKAGEEIREQLYCFEDRGNRSFALRPELTPSLARLVIQKGKSASLPLKWFAVGQCWRYERMTRGRRREHYQWNMDIIGVPEVTVPEILKAMSSYMAVLEYPMTTIDRNAFKVQYYLAWSNRPNIDVGIIYKYGFGWEHNPAYIYV